MLSMHMGIQVARVVQGHVVDDNYPESDPGNLSGDRTSENGMTDSMILGSASHAWGGTVDVAMSDDDDYELGQSQEKLITLVGDVRDKIAIIVDDMIDRPGSFIAAAEHCRLNCGAKKVYIVATMGCLVMGR